MEDDDGMFDVERILPTAWLLVKEVFGDVATPDHAIKVCALIMDELAAGMPEDEDESE
jgi:hypothetical protein